MADKRLVSNKASEDSDLAQLEEKLRTFDSDAPVGTYQMDTPISRLLHEYAKLKLTETFYQAKLSSRDIRSAVLEAARSALLSKHLMKSVLPIQEKSAVDFSRELDLLRAQAFALGNAKVSEIAPAIAIEPVDGMVIYRETEIELIEEQIERVCNASRQLAEQIDEFVRLTYVLPQSKIGSGRTILFTHLFIENMVGSWSNYFGTFDQSDLSKFTQLLATSLEDFDYPLTRIQHQSDGWLRDRIRKQIFRKSNADF